MYRISKFVVNNVVQSWFITTEYSIDFESLGLFSRAPLISSRVSRALVVVGHVPLDRLHLLHAFIRVRGRPKQRSFAVCANKLCFRPQIPDRSSVPPLLVASNARGLRRSFISCFWDSRRSWLQWLSWQVSAAGASSPADQ
uniref:Uncharacterized protein n=1 Tax=Steinernema glaseri TaxID=37863 RepID=A0A1I7ZMX7_9BILA